MDENITILDITKKVNEIATDYEMENSNLKRKYILWNINTFNYVASKLSVLKGTFGTGYPFYVLDKDLKGKIPIITEQIRYNRKLVSEGEKYAKSIWECAKCLRERYSQMPDLKIICKPCPKVINDLKPRKIINRLPDIDMWVVCEDNTIEQAQNELTGLLKQAGITTSDVNPIKTIDEIEEVVIDIKNGKKPKKYLPIDCHLMEYSKMKELIKSVPNEILKCKLNEQKPYMPIHPKSYRKVWQYDDTAYNFVLDFLVSFTPFGFPEELQKCVDKSRKQIASENTPEELFEVFLRIANESTCRRFMTLELKDRFIKRIKDWENIVQEPKEPKGIDNIK